MLENQPDIMPHCRHTEDATAADTLFDEIYDSTSKAVLAFITAKCGRTADISDIFQDTYTELYQVLTKRGAGYIENGSAFVFTLAKRKIARYYTLRERLRSFIPLNAANEDGEEAELPDLADGGIAPEEYAVTQALLDDARKFIQSKPEDVKKVFYLFYDAGLTIPEIASVLSKSESFVKNKLYRTLKELRKLLN